MSLYKGQCIFVLLLLSALLNLTCSNIPLTRTESLELDPPEFFRREIKPESYPDADIVYLLDEEIVLVAEDGSSVAAVHIVFEILHEAGKDYADIEIGYDSRLETVSLVYARTILPDGSILALEEMATKVVTPHLPYPQYSDYKKLTFSMPGVAVGSIMDYKYLRKRNPVLKGHFHDRFIFQTFNPALLTRYEITAPENMDVRYFVRNPMENSTGAPVISHQRRGKSLLWEYENVPMMQYEHDMLPIGETAFNVLVTTLPSWAPFFQWWWAQVADKSEPTPEIVARVEELADGLDTNLAKVETLFDYVKTEIRYVSLGLGKSGYVPEPASKVMRNKYGDCKDKSTLLLSMLKAAGIPSYYVLVPTRSISNLLPEFPYPFQFNHCIIAVEMGESHVFLDPTSATTHFDYLPSVNQGRNAVLIKEGEPIFFRTPLAQPSASGVLSRFDIHIMPDGSADVALYTEISGSEEIEIREVFANFNSKQEREFFQELAGMLSPGAELLEYRSMDPFDYERKFDFAIKFHAENYCHVAGHLMLTPNMNFIDVPDSVIKTQRQHALVRRTRSFYNHWMTFNVPEGYELHWVPEPVMLTDDFFDYISKYNRYGDKLVWTVGLLEKAMVVPASEFKRFSDSYRIIGEANRSRAVFVRNP